MAKCPNCGQEASGDYCQCCKYPILRGRPTRARKAEKEARKEAIEKSRGEFASAIERFTHHLQRHITALQGWSEASSRA